MMRLLPVAVLIKDPERLSELLLTVRLLHLLCHHVEKLVEVDRSVSFTQQYNIIRILHRESKELDSFLFEHNFGKILSDFNVLSLLQTEINCDNAYHTMYHHTSNLLVHYLVK